MSEKTAREGPEAALWRRVRAGRRDLRSASAGPDALTLAAYLDGTLEAGARDRVEAWMVASEDGLDLVLSARGAVSDSAPKVPEGLPRRAKSLVAPRRGGAWRLAAPIEAIAEMFGAPLRPVAWAASLAALVLVSASGFELGRAGVQSVAAVESLLARELAATLSMSSSDDLL